MSQRSNKPSNPETPLNSVGLGGGRSGRQGDVTPGAKFWSHTLAGDTAPRLFNVMITLTLESKQRGSLRCAIHATRGPVGHVACT